MDLLSFTHLSDFEVNLPNKTYKLHKVILSRCGYFNSLFRSDNKENTNSEVNFEYPVHVFDVFINSLYAGACETDWESELTEEILDLAIYFQYEQLVDECIDLITCSPNNVIFISTITKYPHLVDKIEKDKFRKCCSDRLDDIAQLAENIPSLELLILILRTLEDVSINKIFDIVISWLNVNNVQNVKADIIDKIIDVSYSIHHDVISKINNIQYDQSFQLLLGRIMVDSIYYASNSVTYKFTKSNLLANISIDIDLWRKYEITYNNKKICKLADENLAIDIKSELIDNFDLVFHFDEQRILGLKVNQEVNIFCTFISSTGVIVCKRLSLACPISLNTNLFDSDTGIYHLCLMIE